MTAAVTTIITPQASVQVTETSVFQGGGTGGGITQAAADARYVQLSQIDAANGVAGLDASRYVGENRLPLPPVDLTVLLANKLA